MGDVEKESQQPESRSAIMVLMLLIAIVRFFGMVLILSFEANRTCFTLHIMAMVESLLLRINS